MPGEARIDRDRQDLIGGDLDRISPPDHGQTARWVGRVTTNGTLPTGVGKYYLLHPVTPSGLQAEGATGNLTVDTSRKVPVLVLGPSQPHLGDDLNVFGIGGRWVARKDLPSTVETTFLYGCPCSEIPTTLHMSVNDPGLNYGIFQNTTLVYGPTPVEYVPLSIADHSYLSPGSFTDQVTGDSFRYFFTCYGGHYVISRLYVTSVLGSPYRDVYRYTWLIGLEGNTCSPFLLGFGHIYPEGDPSCIVTISA